MAFKDNNQSKKMDIDGESIRELATLMEETGLTEIEVSEGERRIRVARGHAIAAPAMHVPVAAAPAAEAPAAAPASGPTAQTPGAVTSPMVGTVYLRPEPTAPPFVKPGDAVSAGDTLLIIEAMKVMNTIKAPKGGRVAQVMVSDAQPVEFGEVLVVIE
jgi:acetyl-CoA carboxylase biotin carboxyl carrier protein